MSNTHKNIYTLNRENLKNITQFQLEEFLKEFEIDSQGNVLIPYIDRGYTCNDKKHLFEQSGTHAISFFSGCGGLDIGTQMAGVKVLSSLDFYKDSVNTIRKNDFFSHTAHFNEDICNVNGNNFAEIITNNNPEKLILVGGPPCQPFSKAGYWVTNENRKSNEDPRNMIEPYFKLISDIKPDGFVLENVESILHPSNKEAVDTIINNIDRLGYQYSLLKINSADYGIPQKRKRVFFLASKKNINAVLEPTHGDAKKMLTNSNLLPHVNVLDWIGKFDNEKYWKDESLSTEGKWEYELTCIPPGKNYISLSEKAGHPNPTFDAGKRYWSSLLKLHPLQPSWTIIASPGHWEGPFHWNNRRLSIRECAAIQTFPDDYVFHGSIRSQRKQIGNAVPPLLAKMIIEELCRWI
ncbi:DNA cytosine methyltransferase [Clostridium intestinale]|uniref:DNA (cytosine-5-)-methyltransferase n=1 Tax=Clostridium intestinale DSM 6191 TaxID=1121320 RepID=A0A1M5T159_9CLOT|nr:DNA cytosine methyltransferase [Clostridium intestinale]SHH44398.1 DNA (cytosine-5)-methyltransferase 1 [Clostridium intestinale DSM 6191]